MRILVLALRVLSVFLSLSLSFFPCPHVPVAVLLSQSLCPYPTISVTLPLFSVPVCLSQSRSFCPCPSGPVCVPVPFTVILFLSLSQFLCPRRCPSVPVPLSLSILFLLLCPCPLFLSVTVSGPVKAEGEDYH